MVNQNAHHQPKLPSHSYSNALSQYARIQNLKDKKEGDKGFHFSFYPTLQDPEQNQILQWLDVTSTHGIVQLSFPLIQEPILGSYHIVVEKKSGDKEYHFFTVEEYGKQVL